MSSYRIAVIRPVDEDGNASYDDDFEVGKELANQATQALLKADELALLGLTPVKGLLLYGPVGLRFGYLYFSICLHHIRLLTIISFTSFTHSQDVGKYILLDENFFV